MFCTQCGKELPDSARFCAYCGASAAAPEPVPEPAPPQPVPPEAPKPEPVQPEPPQQTPPPEPDGVDAVLREMNLGKKSGKLAGFLIGIVVMAVVFAVMVALKVGLPGGTDTVEGPGFRSPEKAAKAYLEALKDGNAEGMLSTFAMETYVENLDLEVYVEYQRLYAPWHTPMSGDSDLVRAYNLEKRRAEVTEWFPYQYLVLLDPDSGLLKNLPIRVEEKGGASALLRDVTVSDDMETLSELEIGRTQHLEQMEDYAEKVERLLESQKAISGADDVSAVAVEVTVDGRDYLFCPDAACYDGTWYLLNLDGALARFLGAPTNFGGFVPMDELR